MQGSTKLYNASVTKLSPVRKVLYVGPLDSGGTCYARMVALREIGVDVVPFDHRELTNKLGILCRLPITGMFPGQRLDFANEELIRAAAKSTPQVIWIDKGYWLRYKPP